MANKDDPEELALDLLQVKDAEIARLKAEVAAASKATTALLGVLSDNECEIARLKGKAAASHKAEGQDQTKPDNDDSQRVSKRAKVVVYYSDHPLRLGDILPSQRQLAAIQFQMSAHGIFTKLKQEGFVVLELPTADKNKLALAHQSLMSYRCKRTFEGPFLSARRLPLRHVLEFNAGGTAALVEEELPEGEEDWTETHQAEAYNAMQVLKVATTSVLDAICLSTSMGMEGMRHHLLEEDVPGTDRTVSSSILQVVSHAPAAKTADARETANRGMERDLGLLTALYCPTPGLRVQAGRQHSTSFEWIWKDVPLGDATIVLIAGYELEHATLNGLQAYYHRVRPSTSMPWGTVLAYKLRARRSAVVPRGLMQTRALLMKMRTERAL